MATTVLKDRQQLYRLIISQLFYDGYQQIAVNLSQAINAYPSCPPSDRLFHLVNLGLKLDEEAQAEREKNISSIIAPASCLDLEFESDVAPTSPEPAQYETIYVTTHKSLCRTAAFNADGSLFATGSADASIKVLEVEKILQRSALSAEALQNEATALEYHPVIRTLYDHVDEVRSLAFHPREQILASGGVDCTLKFFDYSKVSAKRASKSIQEVEPVRALSFHPTGDFLLVGTNHPVVRLYDVNTLQCYVSPNPKDQHRGPITDLCYADNARMYASASKDGDIKIWDGISNRCVSTFQRAHDGSEVCSVVFSRNGKYVLSSGKDSIVKLWELTASRCLIAYTGAGSTGKQDHRHQAGFNHTEDYVMFPDEKTGSLCSWDARNADRKRLLALGHTATIRGFVHSPTMAAFVTCSEDFRARFWYRRSEPD